MAAVLGATNLILAACLALSAKALDCTVGMEPDLDAGGVLRWVVPVRDPCRCTRLVLGGVNVRAPARPFPVAYLGSSPSPPVGDNVTEIRRLLRCPLWCSHGEPLGMEDGRIPNSSLSVSSYYLNKSTHGPWRARLNTKGYAAAWCVDKSDGSPWIQVHFKSEVRVTGLVTQGRAQQSFSEDQRVEEYQVAYGAREDSLVRIITNTSGSPKTFTGNTDPSSYVTAAFSPALDTRFLRIYPVHCHVLCSMRFEVMGCYL